MQAKVADVEIASEEIKSVRATVDAQESTIQYAEGMHQTRQSISGPNHINTVDHCPECAST